MGLLHTVLDVLGGSVVLVLLAGMGVLAWLQNIASERWPEESRS